MNITLTHTPPQQIIAGDSIEFLVPIPSDYLAWAGSARLTGPVSLNATVTTQGSDFRVYFQGQGNNGSTDTLEPGQYTLTVWATSGSDRKTIASYPLSVAENLATGQPQLPHAVKMLRVIEAALVARVSGNADGGIEEYMVDGVNVRKVSLEDLEKMRARYSAEVARLQNGPAAIGSVKVAFNPAGLPADYARRFG